MPVDKAVGVKEKLSKLVSTKISLSNFPFSI